MQSPRSKVNSERIRNGLVSLVIGALLALVILANADQERRNGNLQLARDSVVMLWSPAIFFGFGLFTIGRGLLGGISVASLRTQLTSSFKTSFRAPAPPRRPKVPKRPRPAPQVRTSPPPPDPVAPTPEPVIASEPSFDDRYRQACSELGVDPGTDWVVIRATWRRKLQTWHPDQGGEHETWLRKKSAYTLLEAWEQFKG